MEEHLGNILVEDTNDDEFRGKERYISKEMVKEIFAQKFVQHSTDEIEKIKEKEDILVLEPAISKEDVENIRKELENKDLIMEDHHTKNKEWKGKLRERDNKGLKEKKRKSLSRQFKDIEKKAKKKKSRYEPVNKEGVRTEVINMEGTSTDVLDEPMGPNHELEREVLTEVPRRELGRSAAEVSKQSKIKKPWVI